MGRICLFLLVCSLAAPFATAQIVVQGGAPPAEIPAGASIWYGTAAPSNTVGANGDYYLNTTTYCLYGPKALGAWPSPCSSSVSQLGYVAENLGNKGMPGGYAPLDANQLLPAANLPAITAINGTSVPGNTASDQTVVTTAPAVGVWTALPACPDLGGNHLNYNLATHGFLCGNTSGTVASVGFGGIAGGANANALLVSGSLSYSGSGLVNANQLGGVPLASLTTGLLKITGGTGVPSAATSTDVTTTLGFAPENSTNKNAPNGYAPLDSSALLPAANLPASAVQTDSYGNMIPIAGGASFGAASLNPGCWYFGDANNLHTLALCNPTSGYTGTVNLWAGPGGTGQATTSDGAGNLGWSSLGGISGTLAAAQFPTQFSLSSNWNLSWSPTAAASGSPALWSLTGPAHTNLANTQFADINLNLSRTVQFAGGGSSFKASGLILNPPTYSAAATQTIAAPTTLVVNGLPACSGSNLTCQIPKGLWVEGSTVNVSGASVAAAYAFEADLPAGATNNWAAYLNGATCIGLSCPTVAAGNTLMVYNGTASTGVTTGVFHAGAGQSTTPVLTVQNNGGASVFNVDAGGNVTASGTVNATQINGTSLAGLATGLLKNTTGTGALSIAAGKDLPAPAGGGPVGGVAAMTANSSTINSATEVSVLSYTVPANTIAAGTTYRIKAWGTCTSSAANPTNLLVRFGSTGTNSDAAILTQTITSAASGSAVPFALEYNVTFRSASAAEVTGFLWNGGASGVSTTVPNAPTPAGTSGLTTTANQVLQFSAYGAASTTSVTLVNATIELVKI